MNLTVPRRIKRGWMNLEVKKIVEETHDTRTLYLQDADEGGRPFDFIAGQYLTFRFDTLADRPIVRSYTMSGAPREKDWIIFTVKLVPGGLVSSYLVREVKVGDILRARGPIGKFCYFPQQDKPHLFMIAGGSGVTPFISILKEYSDRPGQNAPKSMHLLVAYRSQHDLICWKELQWAKSFSHNEIIVTLTREKVDHSDFWHGRPDHEQLNRFFNGRYANSTVMTCGPQPLMDLVIQHCLDHGVNQQDIKTESFES